eukprot:TRINITY_DN6867_c0_g2_i1.p1 TRINITY_DN6867_c0_g2~~TRINITY_DN6867_c0_g2_i1.p1  ORF type:complete len:221 (-),score=15.83 TRINITY_DN6867_c0_g2_i1:706-1368(-)
MAALEEVVPTPGASSNWSWADVVARNREAEVGIKLDFIPQQFFATEVIIDEHDWQQGIVRWENSLIGFIYGLKSNIVKIQNYIRNQWRGEDIVTVAQINQVMFLFKFQNEVHMRNILGKGLWPFENTPLILKPWSALALIELEKVSSIPIWFKLPGLNLHLWIPKVLLKIASVVSKPICTDAVTVTEKRLNFTSICLEILLEFELPNMITLKGLGGVTLE